MQRLFYTQPVQAQSTAEQQLCRHNGQYAVVAIRPLRGHEEGFEPPPTGSIGDSMNLQRGHEHIFFCNGGRVVENVGFGPVTRGDFSGPGTILTNEVPTNYVLRNVTRYDSNVIREVIATYQCSLDYNLITNNCQDFVENVLEEYQKRIWAGEWVGILTQPNRRFNYSISLRRKGSEYIGISRIEYLNNPNYFGVMELKAGIHNNTIVLQEAKIISQTPPPGLRWCLKRGNLQLVVSDRGTFLEGSWSDPGCNAGQVQLQRRGIRR